MKSLKFLLATALAVNVSSPSVRAESSPFKSHLYRNAGLGVLAAIGSYCSYYVYKNHIPESLKEKTKSGLAWIGSSIKAHPQISVFIPTFLGSLILNKISQESEDIARAQKALEGLSMLVSTYAILQPLIRYASGNASFFSFLWEAVKGVGQFFLQSLMLKDQSEELKAQTRPSPRDFPVQCINMVFLLDYVHCVCKVLGWVFGGSYNSMKLGTVEGDNNIINQNGQQTYTGKKSGGNS